ncbi:hypothetical protein V1477_001934 [Vespula maculifrons]|uniref:Uncharacterized protein n=1 Tax=Vespula maculifrons TaxID=7453 RepID=A0ABD2CXJ1_VESMC
MINSIDSMEYIRLSNIRETSRIGIQREGSIVYPISTKSSFSPYMLISFPSRERRKRDGEKILHLLPNNDVDVDDDVDFDDNDDDDDDDDERPSKRHTLLGYNGTRLYNSSIGRQGKIIAIVVVMDNSSSSSGGGDGGSGTTSIEAEKPLRTQSGIASLITENLPNLLLNLWRIQSRWKFIVLIFDPIKRDHHILNSIDFIRSRRSKSEPSLSLASTPLRLGNRPIVTEIGWMLWMMMVVVGGGIVVVVVVAVGTGAFVA